jgi:hypothetical protein
MIHFLRERFGSVDGEREASMTRQIAFEPLPASVLFGHWRSMVFVFMGGYDKI